MLKEIEALRAAFREAEAVMDSDAPAKTKYELVFAHKNKVVMPLLEELGLSLEWYDPDTSYAEDTAAYFYALKDLIKGLPGEKSDDGY